MKLKIFRKTAIIICMGLWLFTAFHFFFDRKNAQDSIVTAFANASLMDVSSKATCFGKYREEYMTQEEKENLLREAARELSIGDYEMITRKDKETTTTILSREGSKGSALLKVITREEKDEEGKVAATQYISMEVSLENSIPSAFAYKERMESVLKKLKIDTAVSLYLTGSISGKLLLPTRNVVADQILSDMKARIVSENRDMECYSIYAYVKNVKDYMLIENKKVNMNLSMSYNEASDRTYIYLATPMNNQDF